MKLLLTAALAGFALGACTQSDNDNVAAENGLTADQTMMTNDPATTDLNMEANATAVDQAINQTDQQSGVEDAAENALDSVDNSAE